MAEKDEVIQIIERANAEAVEKVIPLAKKGYDYLVKRAVEVGSVTTLTNAGLFIISLGIDIDQIIFLLVNAWVISFIGVQYLISSKRSDIRKESNKAMGRMMNKKDLNFRAEYYRLKQQYKEDLVKEAKRIDENYSLKRQDDISLIRSHLEKASEQQLTVMRDNYEERIKGLEAKLEEKAGEIHYLRVRQLEPRNNPPPVSRTSPPTDVEESEGDDLFNQKLKRIKGQ